jgi:hypothetical protein
MKAISLWQPWASLIALGFKKIETRSWAPKYRGPILICAAKKIIGWPSMEIQGVFDGTAFQPSDLPLGKIVCKAKLVSCTRIFIHNRPDYPERAFGDYSSGRFMWKFEDIEPIIPPIPIKGRQGLFNVPDELIKW